ncbi:MAG: glycosyltransferase [Flavobacteriales bacterium AspAUS03]
MKKKILFRTGTLSGGGGVEKSLLMILNQMDFSKYEIDLLLDYNTDAFLDCLPKEIKVYRLVKGNQFSSKLLMNAWIRKIVKRLRSVIGENSLMIRYIYSSILKSKLYDIEIGFIQDIVPQLIKSPLPSKKIAWVHVDLKRRIHGVYESKQLQKIISSFKKVDEIVSVSEGAREALLSLWLELKERIQVIYNPIDLEEVIEKSKERDPKKRDKNLRLIAVGRLMWQKGFDRLINVCHKLKKENFDFELFILGEGPLKGNLIQQIIELGLESHVKLLGFKENPYPYIRTADVFVMSSYVEGFAYVVLEALILNKVIVSTDIAGPRELLRNGALGLLVENSEEGLYEGLKNVLSDDILRMSFMKKEKDFALFDPKKVVRQIENLIDGL